MHPTSGMLNYFFKVILKHLKMDGSLLEIEEPLSLVMRTPVWQWRLLG